MIERDYVEAINKWSESAQKKITNSEEFGTNKKTWIHSIRASQLIAESHYNLAEGIQRNVVDKMISYTKENYAMSILHIKTVKDLAKDFENAQKPWLKLLDKIERTKKSYHEAGRKLKKSEAIEKNKKSDTSALKEQKTEVTDTDSASNKELMALRSEYKKWFDEMENSRPAYENSMKEILDRTYDIERKRLTQFQLLLNTYCEAIIDMERDPCLTKMSTDLKKAIERHDTELDIQWWHDHFASDANNSWPVFEDFIE